MASSSTSATTDERNVAVIRCVAADMPTQAKSGHPGAPLGCAPMAYVLFKRHMSYSPGNPDWWNRDRFVLSNGHGCALLYTMLHLTGYDVSLEDLKAFRTLRSKTPGHPENHVTAGVEVTTGPLGQGMSNAVGMAIAQEHLAATFNKEGHELFSNFTYVITGDGCHQEGVTSEAASLAGHLGLGRLIVLYDDNDITIDGGTELSFSEDVGKRFEAYGWQVLSVADGDADLDAIDGAIAAARQDLTRPTLIKVKTIIGFGSAKEGTSSVHGSPLAIDDLQNVKKKFGLPAEETFHVPDEVRSDMLKLREAGAGKYAAWQAVWNSYAEQYPAEATQLQRRFEGKLPQVALPLPTEVKVDATRKMSGATLNALAPLLSELIGGSADLTPSNCTWLNCSGNFQKDSRQGRYLRFGVREHAMAAVANGLAAYGAFVPFVATFLNFVGYALGAIRLSSLSHLQVIYIMTHDSIGLGEDGPTHQPIETLASLRAMPNHFVWRPADQHEVNAAYVSALKTTTAPTTIALTRQSVNPVPLGSLEKALRGGYVAFETVEGSKPSLTIVATGSEVGIAVDAAKLLTTGGDGSAAASSSSGGKLAVRVVSLPCWEVFLQQPMSYRQKVLPAAPTLSVEAGSTTGWRQFSHAHVGMTTFGASAPYKDVFTHFGFTAENVAARSQKLLQYFSSQAHVSSPLSIEL